MYLYCVCVCNIFHSEIVQVHITQTYIDIIDVLLCNN